MSSMINEYIYHGNENCLLLRLKEFMFTFVFPFLFFCIGLWNNRTLCIKMITLTMQISPGQWWPLQVQMNAILALFEQQALALRALTKCQMKECICSSCQEKRWTKFITRLKLALRVLRLHIHIEISQIWCMKSLHCTVVKVFCINHQMFSSWGTSGVKEEKCY